MKILCGFGADPKLASLPQMYTAFDYAVKMKLEYAYGWLIDAANKLKLDHIEREKSDLFLLLENSPDFSILMKFECSSSIIPFISSFAPSDTFRIYKRGSSVRLDLNSKDKEVNSILYKGRGS